MQCRINVMYLSLNQCDKNRSVQQDMDIFCTCIWSVGRSVLNIGGRNKQKQWAVRWRAEDDELLQYAVCGNHHSAPPHGEYRPPQAQKPQTSQTSARCASPCCVWVRLEAGSSSRFTFFFWLFIYLFIAFLSICIVGHCREVSVKQWACKTFLTTSLNIGPLHWICSHNYTRSACQTWHVALRCY